MSVLSRVEAHVHSCMPDLQRFLQEHGEVQLSALGLGACADRWTIKFAFLT